MALSNASPESDDVSAPQTQLVQVQSEDVEDEPFATLPISANKFLNLLDTLEDYNTTVPNTITANYLSRAGMVTSDNRLVTLVSLAAQKFISDLASDALTHCKMRQASNNNIKKVNKEKKYVMTVEDLAIALEDKGIAVRRPPYYQ
eukprot:GFUD01035530.1.p1 GENE.GFUD01035530.1~~GFUD01035530.1.p1  ORF type:complete len:146 (+),score=56.63 GFUD01035530.1:52-489(+)